MFVLLVHCYSYVCAALLVWIATYTLVLKLEGEGAKTKRAKPVPSDLSAVEVEKLELKKAYIAAQNKAALEESRFEAQKIARQPRVAPLVEKRSAVTVSDAINKAAVEEMAGSAAEEPVCPEPSPAFDDAVSVDSNDQTAEEKRSSAVTLSMARSFAPSLPSLGAASTQMVLLTIPVLVVGLGLLRLERSAFRRFV